MTKKPTPPPRKKESEKKAIHQKQIISTVTDKGHLIELAYDHTKDKALFVSWDGKTHKSIDSYSPKRGIRLIPAKNVATLIKLNVVHFPSGVMEYGNTQDLIEAIRSYIHRYVDVSEDFERLAANYVLLTWVYDRFKELPYLRRRGDYGTGKTRFLTIIGSICYKPIFASGAATASPIFHLINQIGGTLIIDEADFRFSDESALIAKILNCGNEKGYPLLRSETTNGKDYQPRAFKVFGPKIVGMRGRYDDVALESRFLTETSANPSLRSNIPINLPIEQEAEAQILRDKLLLYRFRNFTHSGSPKPIKDAQLEPRMHQILAPLLSIAVDRQDEDAILKHAKGAQAALDDARGQTLEAEVLTIIKKLMMKEASSGVSVKDIAKYHGKAFLDKTSRPIHPRSMGHTIRTKLNIPTQKSNGVFMVPKSQHQALNRLYERYSVTEADVERLAESFGEITTVEYPVDIGDVGGRSHKGKPEQMA